MENGDDPGKLGGNKGKKQWVHFFNSASAHVSHKASSHHHQPEYGLNKGDVNLAKNDLKDKVEKLKTFIVNFEMFPESLKKKLHEINFEKLPEKLEKFLHDSAGTDNSLFKQLNESKNSASIGNVLTVYKEFIQSLIKVLDELISIKSSLDEVNSYQEEGKLPTALGNFEESAKLLQKEIHNNNLHSKTHISSSFDGIITNIVRCFLPNFLPAALSAPEHEKAQTSSTSLGRS
jgi:hypothetical protein